ncbi:MAG: hypothetical protein LBU91_09630 [Bacteroidales bacterium]|jgi:Spy/CpxP family protein refolding chaperone|nr:hypothetical protein [Bacteroidales bacterium]
MDKHKILCWVICLLVILNVSTIVTIVYKNLQTQAHEQTTVVIEAGTVSLSGQYFCQMLELCPEQKCQFCPRHKVFRAKAGKITENIDNAKRAMFQEMHRPNPDLESLDEISEEIGNLHEELKNITVDFYLSVREVCETPEQKKKLKDLFAPLFDDTYNNTGISK